MMKPYVDGPSARRYVQKFPTNAGGESRFVAQGRPHIDRRVIDTDLDFSKPSLIRYGTEAKEYDQKNFYAYLVNPRARDSLGKDFVERTRNQLYISNVSTRTRTLLFTLFGSGCEPYAASAIDEFCSCGHVADMFKRAIEIAVNDDSPPGRVFVLGSLEDIHLERAFDVTSQDISLWLYATFKRKLLQQNPIDNTNMFSVDKDARAYGANIPHRRQLAHPLESIDGSNPRMSRKSLPPATPYSVLDHVPDPVLVTGLDGLSLVNPREIPAPLTDAKRLITGSRAVVQTLADRFDQKYPIHWEESVPDAQRLARGEPSVRITEADRVRYITLTRDSHDASIKLLVNALRKCRDDLAESRRKAIADITPNTVDVDSESILRRTPLRSSRLRYEPIRNLHPIDPGLSRREQSILYSASQPPDRVAHPDGDPDSYFDAPTDFDADPALQLDEINLSRGRAGRFP